MRLGSDMDWETCDGRAKDMHEPNIRVRSSSAIISKFLSFVTTPDSILHNMMDCSRCKVGDNFCFDDSFSGM